MSINPITIVIAGEGETTEANLVDLLNDYLGFGDPDADGYYEVSSREINLIIPVTKESPWTSQLAMVIDWSEKADLPYTLVTDGEGQSALADDAAEIYIATDVSGKVISLLESAEGERAVLLIWGEDGGPLAEELMEKALDNDIPVKDLSEGLDDMNFKSEPEPEPEPAPEPEKPARRRSRRGAAAEEPLVSQETPLTEEDVKPAPEPEVKPKSTRRAKVTPDVLDAAESNPTALQDKAKEAGAKVTEQHNNAGTTELLLKYCQDALDWIKINLPAGMERDQAVIKLGELLFWGTSSLVPVKLVSAKLDTSIPPAADPGPPTQAPVRRGRGRPRADGTPAKPRTEEDLSVAYIETEEGTLRKRGRGRTAAGEKVVYLTAAEVAQAEKDGQIETD